MLRKTLKRSLLVGLIVLSTMSFTGIEVNVKSMGVKSFALYLNDLSTKVQIVLKSSGGYTLYNEQVRDKESISKLFDLTLLNDGDYSLRIEDEFQIKKIPFEIMGDLIVFAQEQLIFKPKITARNSEVLIEMSSMNGAELGVVIRDENNNLVFEEIVVNQKFALRRTYDFSKIKSGNYYFVFNTNGHSVIRDVRIKK